MMPDPIWAEAERLVILCSVDAGEQPGHEQAAETLCREVRELASPGAPLPLSIVGTGDDALGAPGVVALLVQAGLAPSSAAAPGASGQIISFTMRLERRGPFAPPPALFGAAPRVAPYHPGGASGSALSEGLRASLAQVLPWVSQAQKKSPLGPTLQPEE